MFTGIVTQLGKVKDITKNKNGKTFEVKAEKLPKTKIGDSIAINGTCITVTSIKDNTFKFDAIEETLNLTNLNKLEKKDLVNIEFPLTLNQGISGHIVQGHIDTMGKINNIKKTKTLEQLTINHPQQIAKYLAYKGSITINGVSLTISNLTETTLTVDITPHTSKNTNLQYLKKDDTVNIEVDLIAKHLETLLNQKEKETKYYFLKDRGFI